jgi:hypothetical protein
VDLGDGVAHGDEGRRRWAEGVFVRGEFDDLVGWHAEFTGDFLDGPAGLVDWQVGQGGIESIRRFISERLDDPGNVHVFGDEIADQRDFLAILGAGFDGEGVDWTRRPVTVRPGEQDRERA